MSKRNAKIGQRVQNGETADNRKHCRHALPCNRLLSPVL